MQSFDLDFPSGLNSYITGPQLGDYMIQYAQHFNLHRFFRFLGWPLRSWIQKVAKLHCVVGHQHFSVSLNLDDLWVFPHITVGFLFSCLHPARLPSAVPSRPPRLCHLISQLLISHNSSHTQLISHTTHLTHNSSHTQLISHNSSHTQFISHNSSHTPLISHNSSHTTHLTHTTHPTHNSSHTTHLTHNSSHTTHLTHNSSHTTHLTHLISQTCCLAGAVHRASWRSCGADSCRRGRGSLLRGRGSTQGFLKELRRG